MPTSPFFVARGNAKSIGLSELAPDQAAAWFGQRGSPLPLSSAEAWRYLGVFYRAVDVRAKAISRAPLALYQGNGKTDVSGQPRYSALIERLRTLLYLNEAAMCLYGAAYWIIETNVAGRNPTPRWLLPTSMQPVYDTGEVVAFVRTVNGHHTTVPREQVVWWWEPNVTAEAGPGTPVAYRALAAAGVLHYLNLYVSSFFERGAIKAYVLQASGNPPPVERERVKSAWRRLLSGLKAAFSVEVFSHDLTFTALGDSLTETVNPQLTTQAREDILQVFGVPLSLVFSNAANYATAQQDALNFYTATVQPQMEVVHLPPLNRWLATVGLRCEPDWGQLEVFQQQQLAQAQAVTQLVGAPILTVDEGRDLVGYGPRPAPEAPTPPPDAMPADAATAAVAKADLAKWERKAMKRLKESGSAACAFASAAIPAATAAQIGAALATARTHEAVKAAFATAAPGRIRADDVARLLTDDLLRRAARLAQEARRAS